ncbi:MAG: DUF2800 domain-containing protein [Coriobacteriales bacterium]|jgi:hypothetical protein|nr:DUF2800 domain-containing protein [Coriobacteriales bacterium]
MVKKHTLLSASGAHRWLTCTPSARLESEFDENVSEAAAEGTAAHELAEHKLRKALKMRSRKPVSKYESDEMDAYTNGYVEFVTETVKQARLSCPDPLVLIEQRLDFSRYVEGGFGTGDSIVIADGTLHIIDLKYGMGVVVEAEGNPQMMLYALGALEAFDPLYDINEVTMTIYQPRRENVATWSVPKADLYLWAQDVLLPKAVLAFEGGGEYEPGEHCRFCRAEARCRARAEEKLSLAKYEFAMPPILTDEEIGGILGKLDDITSWANDIKAYALDAAINHGKEWPGFKLVEGRSNRRYSDKDAVAGAVSAADCCWWTT